MNFAQGMDGIAIIYLLINKAVREAWPKTLNAGLSATYVPKKQNLLYCSGAEGHPGEEALEEWSLNHKVLTLLCIAC
ncbi:MAG: hypothetical protein F6J99_11600 [Moorea sp. SIO4G3]|nr:hypothetical protein [Moorena sp. SIO4G3]